jgi:hypothetical protein
VVNMSVLSNVSSLAMESREWCVTSSRVCAWRVGQWESSGDGARGVWRVGQWESRGSACLAGELAHYRAARGRNLSS